MSYIWWAVVAMGSYGTTVVLLKLALRQIPPSVALVITNTMLVLAGIGLVLYRGERVASHLGLNWTVAIILAAGLTLSLSIISYYTALSRGPASVVAPIFAMNFAVASILGFLLLGENITLARVMGVLFAAIAVVLLTR
jgi:transporter family protein